MFFYFKFKLYIYRNFEKKETNFQMTLPNKFNKRNMNRSRIDAPAKSKFIYRNWHIVYIYLKTIYKGIL